MSRVPLMRPEFGPSLPELLSGRLSISRRAATIGVVVALVVLLVAIKLATDNGLDQLTVNGKPSFNVLYDAGLLKKVKPHAGELMRLQGRRGRITVDITARAAHLPPFDGDVLGGQLPLYTAQYARRLSTQLPNFALGDEGKARLNQAPGYQIAYTSGTPGNRTYWREVFVMPKADQADRTVVLRMRQTFSGRAGRRGRALLKATKKAFRSFRFGTRRPLFD